MTDNENERELLPIPFRHQSHLLLEQVSLPPNRAAEISALDIVELVEGLPITERRRWRHHISNSAIKARRNARDNHNRAKTSGTIGVAIGGGLLSSAVAGFVATGGLAIIPIAGIAASGVFVFSLGLTAAHLFSKRRNDDDQLAEQYTAIANEIRKDQG